MHEYFVSNFYVLLNLVWCMNISFRILMCSSIWFPIWGLVTHCLKSIILSWSLLLSCSKVYNLLLKSMAYLRISCELNGICWCRYYTMEIIQMDFDTDGFLLILLLILFMEIYTNRNFLNILSGSFYYV